MRRACFLAFVMMLVVGGVWMVRAETPVAPANTQSKVKRLPASVRIVRSPDSSTLTGDSGRCYCVVCGLHSTQPRGVNSEGRETQPLSFTLPPITVRDGEKVNIVDSTEQRFVLAEKAEAGVMMPIVREVLEGTGLEITVLNAGNENVVVDVLADLQSTRQSPDDKPVLVRVDAVRGRLIARTQLGQSVRADFAEQQWYMDVTVTAAP